MAKTRSKRMSRKTAKRKQARFKRPPVATGAAGAVGRKMLKCPDADKEIKVGCYGGCDAVPHHLGHVAPGTTIVFTAPKNDVVINWMPQNPSPLLPPTDPIVVVKGTCSQVFTVGSVGTPSKPVTFHYHVNCYNPSCPVPGADPDMIVP